MSIDASISASTDLLGKVVTDLQSNIALTQDAITGTLKYVTGYTGYSSVEEQQSGNYLALHAACEGADKITVLLENGPITTPQALGSDGLFISRITNKNTQNIIVTASRGNDDSATVTRKFKLSGLTCNAS